MGIKQDFLKEMHQNLIFFFFYGDDIGNNVYTVSPPSHIKKKKTCYKDIFLHKMMHGLHLTHLSPQARVRLCEITPPETIKRNKMEDINKGSSRLLFRHCIRPNFSCLLGDATHNERGAIASANYCHYLFGRSPRTSAGQFHRFQDSRESVRCR